MIGENEMKRDWMIEWEDERDNLQSELETYRQKPILTDDLKGFTIHQIRLTLYKTKPNRIGKSVM